METLTEFGYRSLGNRKSTYGKFTSSGTAVDVPTGLSRIDFISFQGITTQDNQVQVARDTTTTTDKAGDHPGIAHATAITSGAGYMFAAEGV